MNMLTLLNNIAVAIHDDSATQTWCTTNYGQNQEVHIGADTRVPPDTANYPIVHCYFKNKATGYDLQQKAHGFGFTLGINDETESPVVGKDNLVRKTGMLNLESFRILVRDAITGIWDVGTDEIEIATFNSDYDVVDRYPNFFVDIVLMLTEEYYQGLDLWE